MRTEFETIANDIINNDKYKKLILENHHGLSRYEHSLRVAKSTYKITKILNLDYISATRAALLHDFYVDNDYNDIKGLKKGKIHPILAVNNAKTYFTLNAKEENAIRTHMFPLTLKVPTSKEGIILNLTDTGIAIYECSKFELSMVVSIWLLFIFNIFTISNK